MGMAQPFIDQAFMLAQTAAENGALNEARRFNSARLQAAAKREEGRAVDATVRGGMAAGRARSAGSMVTGQQQLAFAAGGVDAQSGTAAQLGDATRAYAELDAQTLRHNARLEAMGHRQAAQEFRDTDRLQEMEHRGRLAALQVRAGAESAKNMMKIVGAGGGGGGGSFLGGL